jgi:hypothetical protein
MGDFGTANDYRIAISEVLKAGRRIEDAERFAPRLG